MSFNPNGTSRNEPNVSSQIERNPFTALRTATMFLTRFPVGGNKSHEDIALSATLWVFPVVGVLVGLCGAFAYYLGDAVGLPPPLSAIAAVATMYVATGGLHEDGLADCADGFGGGSSRERKLAIMRDSRVGSYGVAAIIFSILARVAILGSLGDPATVCAALVASAALSRGAMGPVMAMLPAARDDGLSVSAGRPYMGQTLVGGAIAFVVAWFALGFGMALLALLVSVVAMLLVAAVARKQIAGQTGDVLGAVAQVVEIAALTAISAR
jgi:adenosylcobinamide-GDP ribazoletransferase